MGERIAVIGAGAVGTITAAYLTGNNFDVILCDREEQCREDFDAIVRDGITVEGSGLIAGLRPGRMTHDIEDTMAANRILVCVSSGRQEEVAAWMAPYVRADQEILIIPGNLGAVVFHRVFQKRSVSCGLLAELAESPWACRRMAPGCYVSAMPLGRRRIAAFPSKNTLRAMERFKDLFPLKAGKNLVENCLNSPNVLTHLSGTLLNLGGIARKGTEFSLFTDGLSDGYIRCLELLEEERSRVVTALGMECYVASVRPLIDKLKQAEEYPELDAFRQLSGPDGLNHRYITEDAACGVALLVSSAKRCGIKVPVTEALLTLAGQLNGQDYYRSGRTWEWLNGDEADI